jgi:hypothetical protein
MADSEWEVVPNTKNAEPESEWEVVQEPPSSLQSHSNETFGQSLLRAPFRMGEDAYRAGGRMAHEAPGYISELPKNIGGAMYDARNNPGQLMNQAAAGITEQGHNLLNIPYNAAQYGANRLNLIPQDFADQVPHQKDISSQINQYFGDPKTAGEKFVRSLARNSENLLGMKGSFSALNPMQLTSKAIAKDVVKEGERQYAGHTRLYNKLFSDADRQGFNRVTYDPHLVNNNLAYIQQYQTPKAYGSVVDFTHNPNLETGHRAVSDLKKITRQLEENEKTKPLTGEERNLYDAADHTARHIENNMFRNANGDRNNFLRNKYGVISQSYKENVVPYKYNKAIQQFIDKKMTARELIDQLKGGEFAVKKGSVHPAINRAEALRKIMSNRVAQTALGTALGGGVAGLGYQYLTGKKEE